MTERLRSESGQVLPLMVLMFVVLLGFASLVIDVGRLHVAHEQLVSAVDAAALAAGNDFPKSENAYQAALNYDGSTGEQNRLGDGITVTSTQVTFECNSAATADGVDCQNDQSTNASGNSYNCSPPGAQTASTTTCNAVKVTQTATVNLTIGGIFHKSWTISDSAVAAARGGTSKPINAFVILDSTESMINTQCGVAVANTPGASPDPIASPGDPPAGGNTEDLYGANNQNSVPQKIDCAKAGVRTLLQLLWPCDSETTCGTSTTPNGGGELGANVSNPMDEVGLLTIPQIKNTADVGDEIDCNPLHAADASNTTLSLTAGGSLTTDNLTTAAYPSWKSYAYSPGGTNGGIPVADEQPGFEAVGLSSDYRSSGGDDTTDNSDMGLNPSSDIVDAVGWLQCPAYTYTTTGSGTKTVYSAPSPYKNPSGAACDTYQQYTKTNNKYTATGSSVTCGGTHDSGATEQADTECDTASNYDSQTAQFTTSIYTYKSGRTTDYYEATCTPYWTVPNSTLTQYAAGSWPGGDFYGLKAVGGQGTQLAGAITEAQYLLTQNARSGALNVIIVVSDGQMNSGGNYCSQAIAAAQQATAAGTTVYAIGYGNTGTNKCDSSDKTTVTGAGTVNASNDTDTQVLENIASNYLSTTNPDPNTFIQGGDDLSTAFTQAYESFSTPRLLPPSDG